MYWSEGIGDAMYRSALDGTNIETLLNTSTEVVGELIDSSENAMSVFHLITSI